MEPWTPKEAIDLIEKLLDFEPTKRSTALEALEHPFFDELKVKKRAAII